MKESNDDNEDIKYNNIILVDNDNNENNDNNDNNDNDDKINLIYKYFTAILNFEEELKKDFDCYKINRADIVKLEDYEQFKDSISYYCLKKNNNDESTCLNTINDLIESNTINEIKKIDKVIIKSSKELINLIKDGNQYILISRELGNLICNEIKNCNRLYMYLIDDPDLILYLDTLDTNEYLCLSFNDNIINEKSFCNFQNKKKLEIEKEITEYNKFENKIIEELKKQNNTNVKYFGYLVDKKWIDEWKKITHYDNYSENNIDISDIVKQQLLFYCQNEEKKKKAIKLFHFKSRTEMRKENKDTSFVIINDLFYHLITKKELEDKYKFPFTFSDGIITIFINNKPQEFRSSNNIIESINEKEKAKKLEKGKIDDFEIIEKKSNNNIQIINSFNSFNNTDKKDNYHKINNIANNKIINLNIKNKNIDNKNIDNNNKDKNNNIDNNNINNNEIINLDIKNNDIDNDDIDNNEIITLNVENNDIDNSDINNANKDKNNIDNNNIDNKNIDINKIDNNNIDNNKIDNNEFIIIDCQNNISNEQDEQLNNIIISNDNKINNIQNNEINKKKELDIKYNFKCCPNIGLQNIGATCYMNATLQCFCHIKIFVNFFKYNPQINKINNNNSTLSSSFKILIDQLWPDDYDFNSSKNKYYAPEEFKKKISKMNPLFEGIAANDAKDLVNFIIMTLHEELNKADNKNDIYDINVDQTNKQLIFNNFANDFMAKNKSIISDIFYSINCSITECLNCKVKIYNYQTYFFMTFPLEEVRKFKNENNFNNINQFNYFNNCMNINNNSVNLYDCFNYDRKRNIMSGDNAMYCNYCKKTSNSCMYTNLVTGPEILILLLNRGKGIQFNVKIYFEENLNLGNYIEFQNTGFNYKLIGVITHIGESSMNGHFIAFCKDPISEKWFKYNDAIVTEINDFQKEVINFGMPYLLFYQKSN